MSSIKMVNAYRIGFGIWRLFHEKLNEYDTSDPTSFLTMISQVQPYIDELDLDTRLPDFFSLSRNDVINKYFAYGGEIHAKIVAKYGVEIGAYYELGFGLQNSIMAFAVKAFSEGFRLSRDGPTVDGFLAAFAEPWESIPNRPTSLIEEFQAIRHILILSLDEGERELKPDTANKQRVYKFAQAVHSFVTNPDKTKEASLKIFFCYARKDKVLREELEKHLEPLRRSGKITTWHDREIQPGQEWEKEIDKHLNSSNVVLLLISPDFMRSDYCYSREMSRALERHNAGEARVVPVILRPVDWKGTQIGKLQALPRDGKPITLWGNRDSAFENVIEGIYEIINSLL